MSTSTSTTHHCLLLFLILCLSLHACNARRLDTTVYNKPENKSAKEKGSDHNIPVVPNMKAFSESFSSKAADLEVANGDEADQSDTKANDLSRKTKLGFSTSGAVDDQHHITTDDDDDEDDDKSSLVSVSWRVPRKKRGIQKQPGFNLDYSPPKTHPPSHN